MALFGTKWHFLRGSPSPIFSLGSDFRLRRPKTWAHVAGGRSNPCDLPRGPRCHLRGGCRHGRSNLHRPSARQNQRATSHSDFANRSAFSWHARPCASCATMRVMRDHAHYGRPNAPCVPRAMGSAGDVEANNGSDGAQALKSLRSLCAPLEEESWKYPCRRYSP
jgi:hypothetical protein